MAERKSLSDVLNFRVEEALAREIERIGRSEGKKASEVARELLAYGVEVHRQIEASYLLLPYTMDVKKVSGRVVIEAAWKPYSKRELDELYDEAEALGY